MVFHLRAGSATGAATSFPCAVWGENLHAGARAAPMLRWGRDSIFFFFLRLFFFFLWQSGRSSAGIGRPRPGGGAAAPAGARRLRPVLSANNRPPACRESAVAEHPLLLHKHPLSLHKTPAFPSKTPAFPAPKQPGEAAPRPRRHYSRGRAPPAVRREKAAGFRSEIKILLCNAHF